MSKGKGLGILHDPYNHPWAVTHAEDFGHSDKNVSETVSLAHGLTGPQFWSRSLCGQQQDLSQSQPGSTKAMRHRLLTAAASSDDASERDSPSASTQHCATFTERLGRQQWLSTGFRCMTTPCQLE